MIVSLRARLNWASPREQIMKPLITIQQAAAICKCKFPVAAISVVFCWGGFSVREDWAVSVLGGGGDGSGSAAWLSGAGVMVRKMRQNSVEILCAVSHFFLSGSVGFRFGRAFLAKRTTILSRFDELYKSTF